MTLPHRLIFFALVLGGFVYMTLGIYGAVRFWERHIEQADCVNRRLDGT